VAQTRGLAAGSASKTQTRAQNFLGGAHKSLAGHTMAQIRKNAKFHNLRSRYVFFAIVMIDAFLKGALDQNR
jgi:hypothetical protein